MAEEIDRDNKEFNQGVLHVVDMLSNALEAKGWTQGDGSEDYDEDLRQTLWNILTAAGLHDPDDGVMATLGPGWRPVEDMTREERYAGGYLLHGPALVDLDFNPQGVERGYFQDDAKPGHWTGDGPEVATGELPPEKGCWCVPGWDANNDLYFNRYIAQGGQGVTHFAQVPSGQHSERSS